MEVSHFSEMQAEFTEQINKMVWCNVATVDSKGRPRSRILHPIWEGTVAWIATRPQSHKAKHLALNPHVSLAYIADIAKPVYVDAYAEWVLDNPTKQRIWDLIAHTPSPVGYNPQPVFGAVDDPRFGVLKITPWRIEVYKYPQPNLVWHAP